jgi:hypothetical protein
MRSALCLRHGRRWCHKIRVHAERDLPREPHISATLRLHGG